MKVFKFGGASVKDASAIRNVADILQQYAGQPLTVVVSALGKTTNALELVAEAYFHQTGKAQERLDEVYALHCRIASELLTAEAAPVLYADLQALTDQVARMFAYKPQAAFNFVYDQIVGLGELLSTKIVAAYLNQQGIATEWVDVRQLVRTDNTYREGQINWKLTTRQILDCVPALSKQKIVLTQGFLGGTIEGFMTTLGREGSDYTAAVFANILDAESMTVWKDVPGILNADPRLISNAVKISRLSYYEAIEMTYYGAHVIHPKTIKPLQNKGIPLHVRSFVLPNEDGTVVGKDAETEAIVLPPIIVIKPNQLLVSMLSKDFSFMAEENLSHIYRLFAQYYIKTNLTQNAAISFSACIDNTPNRIRELMEELAEGYILKRNENLTLITIRHYTPQILAEYLAKNEVVLEQKSRQTVQLLVKS